MTGARPTSDLAFRLAERIKTGSPWEVFGERSRRYEIHLQGAEVELERGPLSFEGYGVRVFRPQGSGLGTGFQGSTDHTPKGLEAAVADAETSSRYAEFPAKSVELPSGTSSGTSVPVVDPKLWSDPVGAVREYVAALLAPFEGRKGAVPSFGSVKVRLSEFTLANSAGLRVDYAATTADLELAVKAFGGPEGAPPGEYWVNESFRRLDPKRVRAQVDTWCQYAADVRRAVPPPGGELAVVLPTEVLTGILNPVIGSRFAASARLRKLAPEVGTSVGPERLTITDEGDYPWSAGSSPFDDEGAPRGKHPLISKGSVSGHLYDTLYASALNARSTASATRAAIGPTGGLRFAHAPFPSPSTLVLAAGDGGTTEELVEAAGDGILVTQLGWAAPDPISGAFGGEIRIGYRIRGGRLSEPVRGGTVGGVVLAPPGAPSLLANLEAVGSHTTLSDQLAAPPILARPLSVAGA